MADSSPLLTDSGSTEHVQTIDQVMEQYVGEGSGWAQFWQVLLVSLAWVFETQQAFITIFTDANPPWHCTHDSPLTGLSSCQSGSNICRLPPGSWTWDNPPDASIVSDWSLQCSSSFMAKLPSSSLFAGSLLGGFVLVTLADSLGRKKLLALSCFTMSVAAALTVFSTNIWVYSGLRFASGFGRSGIGACVLVLSTELVEKRWRSRVGLIGLLFNTFGLLSLPAMAYLTRGKSWKTLYILTSIPSIFHSILVLVFVFESPRWLILKGREQEAFAILEKFMNPESPIRSLNLSEVPVKMEIDATGDPLSAIKSLLDKKWALKRLAAVMAVGFGISVTYYGVPLSIGDLSPNPYLNVALSALMELPGMGLTLIFIDRWEKRNTLLLFAVISGASSVTCAALGNRFGELRVAVELVSFLTGCTALAVSIVYALEMFPTSVRNSATAVTRQAQMVAGVVTPALIAAGKYSPFFSYGAFGVIIVISGLIAAVLPPSKGDSVFYDTMDEQEKMERAALRGD